LPFNRARILSLDNGREGSTAAMLVTFSRINCSQPVRPSRKARDRPWRRIGRDRGAGLGDHPPECRMPRPILTLAATRPAPQSTAPT